MNEIETQSEKFLASKSEKRLHRWGFKDSGFELDGEKSVTFSGSRYEVSGTSMPDFIPPILKMFWVLNSMKVMSSLQ